MKKIIEENGKFYFQNEDGKILYDDEIKKIKICDCHNYRVPLIWTFAFVGAEYWCPYCGATRGMLGAGKNIPITKELYERFEKYKESSKDYLRAKSLQICNNLMFEGKRITPDELPDEEKEKYVKIIKDWKYNVKL